MPTPNPDPRRERIATAALDFNERCAKAFGWKYHKGAEYCGAETEGYWRDYDGVLRVYGLPDFADSPEWCWKATKELIDAEWCLGIYAATNDPDDCERAYQWDDLMGGPVGHTMRARHTDLSACTMLAYCEMKETT